MRGGRPGEQPACVAAAGRLLDYPVGHVACHLPKPVGRRPTITHHEERPVAVVTGGAVRVGRAIAVALAQAGYDILLHYHSSETQARTTAEAIRALGAKVALARADLSDPEQVALPFEAAREAFVHIDLLVNSAAVFPRVPPLEATPEDWDFVFAVNARAPFLCSLRAAAFMGSRGGSIVNIIDTGAGEAWPNYVPYVASKAALASVTKGLAAALAPAVRVNGVSPGAVLLPEGENDQADREAAARRTVLRRVGAPDDVAAAVVYLAGASYVTGEIIRVDGGQHLKVRRTEG